MSTTGIYKSRAGREEIARWCHAELAAWETPHETSTVATSIGETTAVTAGAGPPVVLIPGTNFASAAWLEVVAALAAAHRVVAVDLPGQPGLSAPVRPDRPAVAYGDWLGEVVAELGLHRPVVLGHSLGGLVALAGAARGAAVAGLVLAAPAGLVRLRVPPALLARTVPWLLRPSLETSAGLLATMTTEPVPTRLPAWMTLVGRHVRTSLAPPALPDAAVRRVAVPVRVYGASHDGMLPPRRLRTGAARLPDARFCEVAGAGHLLPHERPELLVDAVGQGPG